MRDWIDVSVPIRDGMAHWPTDPPVRIGLADSIERGDAANVTKLEMSAHTATHLDAPRHFIADGAGIDRFPLDAAIGPARVVDIKDPEAVREPELARHELRESERVLLKTENSNRSWWDEGLEDFVAIEPAAAAALVRARVLLVGIDYLSVGGAEKGAETHRALLEAGIWIVEGLDLSRVGPGEYELICLPIKIADSDGAPARVLLRPRSSGQGLEDG
jgi:arylformamidase